LFTKKVENESLYFTQDFLLKLNFYKLFIQYILNFAFLSK